MPSYTREDDMAIIGQLTAERDALRAKLDAQLALHEQGRVENERLRAEVADVADSFEKLSEIEFATRTQLRELQEVLTRSRQEWAEAMERQSLELRGLAEGYELDLRRLVEAAREVAEHNFVSGPGFDIRHVPDVRAVELSALEALSSVLTKVAL